MLILLAINVILINVILAELRFDNSFERLYQRSPSQSTIPFYWNVIMSAPIDECYCDNPYLSTLSPCDQWQSISNCKNKTNGAYAWGMVRTYDKIFWGDVSNLVCFFVNSSFLSDDMICEGNGRDSRMPRMYMYNELSGEVKQLGSNMEEEHLNRLNSTLGLRAAGFAHGVVLFGGLSTSTNEVNIFAFVEHDGMFLDSVSFANSNDVRKFSIGIGHSLYVGISRTDGTGDIYRYRGSIDKPLAFELIANLPGNPAELLVTKNGHLLVGSWPIGGIQNISTSILIPASIRMSPLPVDEMPAIDRANTSSWRKLWSVEFYEPDIVIAHAYGMSVSIEMNEWIYFGLMYNQKGALGLYDKIYGQPSTEQELQRRYRRTKRATSLFRMTNIDKEQPTVELLYGDNYFSVYDNRTKSWSLEPNRANLTPRFGRSGFGNINNSYIWSMTSYNNYILIGTLDITQPMPFQTTQFSRHVSGSDLYVLEINDDYQIQPAAWISLNGLDNPYNIGIRNLVQNPYLQSKHIYVGTANPYNINPQGGWKIYQLNFPNLS
jgi:hypothetical protein